MINFLDVENNKQTKELEEILKNGSFDQKMVKKFEERIQEGNLSIDENPESHFCVYFPAFDLKKKQVFIGHHRKAEQWLFSGGHIDKGEVIGETLKREIEEEWGLDIEDLSVGSPELLTITKIKKNSVRPCKIHYDLWCFVSVDKNEFNPLNENLLEEFYEIGWKNLDEARELINQENNLKAVDYIEKNYFGL